MATKVTAPEPTGNTFELSDDQLELLAPKRGRAVTPSVFADDVLAALAHGNAVGVKVTGSLKAPYIIGQLAKAERQYNSEHADAPITVQRWNREEQGFVGFKVTKLTEAEIKSRAEAAEKRAATSAAKDAA